MPYLKLHAGKIVLRDLKAVLLDGPQDCCYCCCVPDPENEGQTIIDPSITSEAGCISAGGNWGECPFFCKPCDCQCDWGGGLSITGEGEYAFTVYPGNYFPFPGLFPPPAGFCTQGPQGPYLSRRFGPILPGTYADSFRADVLIYISVDCCLGTITVAAGIMMYKLVYAYGELYCGTLNAIITSRYPMRGCGCSPCPAPEPEITITQQWTPEPGGPGGVNAQLGYTGETPECPSTIDDIQDAGMYLGDILNPQPNLICQAGTAC